MNAVMRIVGIGLMIVGGFITLICFIMYDSTKDGSMFGSITVFIIMGAPLLAGGFYLIRKSKLRIQTENQKMIDQKNLLAQQKAEKERLDEELRQNEIKQKYPEFAQNIIDKKLTLGMTLDMVTVFLSEPSDRKESVMKTKTTEKYYFRPYKNAQNKTSYRLEVTFENGLVNGWKDL